MMTSGACILRGDDELGSHEPWRNLTNDGGVMADPPRPLLLLSTTTGWCCCALKLATTPLVIPTTRLVGVVVRVGRQDRETAGCRWPSQRVSLRRTPWPA
jgi:hypothetical protein